MRIIGCDLHSRQQTIAMLDTETGEVMNLMLNHEGNEVREFYAQLPRPVLVGIEATGAMQWFLNLMDELGITCQVGHPATIRAAEPRKQKHDRRDAELILKLLAEKRFPAIWLPSKELLDLRALLLHRHQWVRIRTRIQNALQAIALANGLPTRSESVELRRASQDRLLAVAAPCLVSTHLIKSVALPIGVCLVVNEISGKSKEEMQTIVENFRKNAVPPRRTPWKPEPASSKRSTLTAPSTPLRCRQNPATRRVKGI